MKQKIVACSNNYMKVNINAFIKPITNWYKTLIMGGLKDTWWNAMNK